MSKLSFTRLVRAFALLFLVPAISHAQVPEWIWHNTTATNNEVRFFRKSFIVDDRVTRATLSITVDDEGEIWVNGHKEKDVKGWNTATQVDLTRSLKPAENVIAIRGVNGQGDAALLARLEITLPKRKTQTVVTDSTWYVSAVEEKGWHDKAFKPGGNWLPAISRGKHGVQPWGDVLKAAKATPAAEITVLPDFKIDLIHSSEVGQGSWICMAIDERGRLIISPQQDDLPLWRITLSPTKTIQKMEQLKMPIRQAMGLLFAHGSLYANAHGPKGTGLYRLVDKNRNDQFEENEITLLKNFKGEGEHGYHGLAVGPDGMIYVMNGNHTKVPEGLSAESPHRNYDEDFLLTRQWDAGGHAVGIMAPGGYVARTDAEGKNWELVLAGFRNAYDLDFNADGELFTFDSDMEWEWGMPWYRPTRIYHAVSGADFGWRSGSAKWPKYYPDATPGTLDIAIGSPTGTKFGTGSNYPEKYKRAFYAMDWSYGRIFAVHLTPNGASYSASYETFVKGKPLNVTDLEFGADGAMYFITGGRGTQSGLYRVSHVGSKKAPKKTKAELYGEEAAKHMRDLRQALAFFHGHKSTNAVKTVWSYLGSEDPFIRHAARIALESQDVAQWKERAIRERDPRTGLTALLALARVGGKDTQRDLLLALKNYPLNSLSEAQKLEKLRIIELSFIRQGKPDSDLAQMAIEKLNQQYPSTSEAMNRELCQLLIYLEAPDVIEKTFALMDKAGTIEEQIHYLLHLRNLKTGWTIEQRRKYFEWFDKDKSNAQHPTQLVAWFKEAGRDYSDGASFSKQLANIKKDAIATLSESEKVALNDLIGDKNAAPVVKAPAKERKFVKEWQLADFESLLEGVGHGRNFDSGKAAFTDAQCIACHRFGNDGGSVGPELTAASSKYSRRDILEAIVAPSKVVSEQYQNLRIIKKDGDDFTGRVVDENNDRIVLQTNPLVAESKVEIKKSDIWQRKPAALSPMPEGLINTLSQNEVLDLLAYIESVGKAKADNFKK